MQPTFEVLAIAVNSGLVAYPAAYTRLWSGAGGAIWRAVPPPGYVAAGDLFTAGDEEPDLSDMVCLHGELLRCWWMDRAGGGGMATCCGPQPSSPLSHRAHPCTQNALCFNTGIRLTMSLSAGCAEGTVVECPPGERLTLPPQLPHAPSVTAAAAAALPRLELWCLDNSLGTFWAAMGQLPVPEHGHDLRNPLGVTPAALLAIGAAAEESAAWAMPGQRLRQAGQQGEAAAQPEAAAPQLSRQSSAARLAKRRDAGQMFRTFEESRRELRTEAVARLVTPTSALCRCAAPRHLPACLPHAGCSLGARVASAMAAVPGISTDAPLTSSHQSVTPPTPSLPCPLLQSWTSAGCGTGTATPPRPALRGCPSGGRCRRRATPPWATAWSGATTRRPPPAWCRTRVSGGGWVGWVGGPGGGWGGGGGGGGGARGAMHQGRRRCGAGHG
jgi:hypothetical protein